MAPTFLARFVHGALTDFIRGRIWKEISFFSVRICRRISLWWLRFTVQNIYTSCNSGWRRYDGGNDSSTNDIQWSHWKGLSVNSFYGSQLPLHSFCTDCGRSRHGGPIHLNPNMFLFFILLTDIPYPSIRLGEPFPMS